jgi:hypothetical protein
MSSGSITAARWIRNPRRILRQTKLKKPDLSLAVYEMRGPVPQVLAEAYRDVADLVMFESYVSNQRQYWWIASPGLVRAAVWHSAEDDSSFSGWGRAAIPARTGLKQKRSSNSRFVSFG